MPVSDLNVEANRIRSEHMDSFIAYTANNKSNHTSGNTGLTAGDHLIVFQETVKWESLG